VNVVKDKLTYEASVGNTVNYYFGKALRTWKKKSIIEDNQEDYLHL
jgi:hypothetical protein